MSLRREIESIKQRRSTLNNITIEYLQCDFSKNFVDFRIQGLHNKKIMNEVVRIHANDMYKVKLVKKPIKSSIEFLRKVKDIKNNTNNKTIKRILVNLAVKQHKIHEEELEELMLMLELGNSNQANKISNNSIITYNSLGSKIYHM